jgi:hypothetical protein
MIDHIKKEIPSVVIYAYNESEKQIPNTDILYKFDVRLTCTVIIGINKTMRFAASLFG